MVATAACVLLDTAACRLIGCPHRFRRRLTRGTFLIASNCAVLSHPILPAERINALNKGSCRKSERAFSDIKIKD